MVMKVHGSVLSPPVLRVFAALCEKDLEFEFVFVEVKAGEHKKEPFLALNPFGQVPAFEDGDLKLFESRAVTQHIAHVFADEGTPLICEGKSMATVGVWMEVEAQQFEPLALKLRREFLYKPRSGVATDAAVVEESEAKLAKVLDVYEARLSQSKYLGCDCFTLADLHPLPTMTTLMGTPVRKLFDARPKLSAWLADISARPAWAKVLAMRNQQ
ncbi:glutathione S-transferase isoform X4 [Eucalyptus grandis]|uniref:glutathione S-transferase isoform X4 n=1 Tax=Eucalyptus grandis TaxID=71139 RepID=UPI00192EEB6F|nr:glutathione S-transferase isoform X4 [Eucalyptus grandis]